jgi:hypothetical protein
VFLLKIDFSEVSLNSCFFICKRMTQSQIQKFCWIVLHYFACFHSPDDLIEGNERIP